MRVEARAKASRRAREKAGGVAQAFGAALGPVYSVNSLNQSYTEPFGEQLDRVEVTGSSMWRGRSVQPTVNFSERVATVFESRR